MGGAGTPSNTTAASASDASRSASTIGAPPPTTGAVACNKVPGMRSSTKEENQHCHQLKGKGKCMADSECRWVNLAAGSGGEKMCKPKCHRKEGSTNASEENEPVSDQEPAAQETDTTNSTVSG